MTDTLKEIYAGTLTYGNYSSGLQTLTNTDAATQYVIRDASVGASTYGTSPPLLMVNDHSVGALGTSLSGWEIVDINSALKIKNNMVSEPVFFDVSLMDSGTSAMAYASAGGLDTATTAGFGPTAHSMPTLTSITTAFTNYSYIVWWGMIGSNFYYATHNGNDSQALYRRAGGINGTETTVFTGNYTGICFDGTSSFYWVQSNTLKKHDAATGTTSNFFAGSFPAGTTYCGICVVNNVVFWLSCYSGAGNYYVCDTVKGKMSYLPYAEQFSSSTPGMIPFYDSATSTFKIYVGSMSTVSSLGILTASYDTNSGNVSGVKYTSSAAFGISDMSMRSAFVADSVVIAMGTSANTSTMYLLDSSLKLIATKPLPGPVMAGYAYGNSRATRKVSPTTSDKNVLGPSITLRITGIKTT